MKSKIFITIALLVFNLNVFAQFKKGDKEVSLNANVIYSNSKISNTPIKTEIKTLSLNSGVYAKYYFKDFLSVGVGLKYNWTSQEAVNTIHNDSILIESTNSKEINIIIPSVELEYNYELFKNFYVKASLNTNYGLATFSEQANYIELKLEIPGYYQLENGNVISSGNYKEFGEYNYISVDIKPKLQYYFNDKIGLTLGLGSGEYFATDNLFLFTFGPAFWTLGADIKF